MDYENTVVCIKYVGERKHPPKRMNDWDTLSPEKLQCGRCDRMFFYGEYGVFICQPQCAGDKGEDEHHFTL